jgi:hypothetical protein
MFAVKIKNQRFYFKAWTGTDTDRPRWTFKKDQIHQFNTREDAESVLFVLAKLNKVNWNVEIVEL